MCDYCVDQWGKNTYDDQEKVLKIADMIIRCNRYDNYDQMEASLVVLRQEMYLQQGSNRV